MNFLPERPKAIIRKYEQIETREELKAACEEIADQIDHLLLLYARACLIAFGSFSLESSISR